MTTTIAILKAATFWSNGRYMKLLLSHMENDRKEAVSDKNVKKMMRIADISRRITAGSIIMCNFIVFTYVTLRTFLLPYTGRILYYRAYYPYDTAIFPYFELTLIGQITAELYAANSYTAVDTFMTMLMLHVCGQFSSLRKKLSKLCTKSNNNFRSDLARIVQKYNMLNRYAETIEDRFNGMLLIQMLGCTIQLCVQSYQAISVVIKETNLVILIRYKVLFPIGFMFFFITLPQTTNLYFIWGDFELIVENLSVANMTTTIATLKAATFWSNGRYMKLLLSRMEDDRKEATTEENVRKMTRIANISRRITAGSIIMCNFLVFTYVTLTTLMLPYTGRVLYYHGYFPYDTSIFPNFELTLIGQITAELYAANSYTAVDTFMTMLMLHVCGQFSSLRKKLSTLRCENNNNFRTDLARIVEKYDMLNRYAETIEDRFNGMLLIQMLGCTVQLCVQSYQVISSFVDDNQGLLLVRLFFFAVYTTYVMLHIYLYCYVGQKLFSEGIKVAYAAYDCNWYNLSPKEAKNLTIIMSRTQIASRITAGKFCSFDHQLFGNIIKTSMGYLSVLYAMKTKDVH
uniref:Odorant receptor n=2 Tax=Vespula pensylvanica TaxID=30213 RepID=A0A834UDU8_VESPE|nr:hypothetical protein H0235_005360 [Vespula pensylvanica]